jgi:hypothetical protein
VPRPRLATTARRTRRAETGARPGQATGSCRWRQAPRPPPAEDACLPLPTMLPGQDAAPPATRRVAAPYPRCGACQRDDASRTCARASRRVTSVRRSVRDVGPVSRLCHRGRFRQPRDVGLVDERVGGHPAAVLIMLSGGSASSPCCSARYTVALDTPKVRIRSADRFPVGAQRPAGRGPGSAVAAGQCADRAAGPPAGPPPPARASAPARRVDTVLSDDVLDRIDEIVPPGTDIGTPSTRHTCRPAAIQKTQLHRRPLSERFAA